VVYSSLSLRMSGLDYVPLCSQPRETPWSVFQDGTINACFTDISLIEREIYLRRVWKAAPPSTANATNVSRRLDPLRPNRPAHRGTVRRQGPAPVPISSLAGLFKLTFVEISSITPAINVCLPQRFLVQQRGRGQSLSRGHPQPPSAPPGHF